MDLSDRGPAPDDAGPTPPPAPAPDVVPASVDLLPCPHSDSELVHKLAGLLLPALSTAAVDSTAGDPFNSPSSVASDLRRDLVDHLLSLSLTFIPQTLASLAVDPATPSPSSSLALPDLDDPLDVVSHLLDLFSSPRRSLVARLSVWILSDSRDDKIDSFAHDMSSSSFWTLDRRQSLADQVLKNIDYKNRFHCNRKFTSQPDLDLHKAHCDFRPVQCRNDGCMVTYCKLHEENHDRVCAYKVLDCEQRCGERIVRREMDRHCITVCRMKMMNCPFFQAGCGSAFPQGQVEEHCREFLRGHLVCVMGVKNEEGLEREEIERRADTLDKSQFRDELSEATNVRRLTLAIKKVEAKMKKQQELDKENIQKEQAHNIKKQEELCKEKIQKEQADSIKKQEEPDKNMIQNEQANNAEKQQEANKNSIQNEQAKNIEPQEEFDSIKNEQDDNIKQQQLELGEDNIKNDRVSLREQQQELHSILSEQANDLEQKREVDEDIYQSEQPNIQKEEAKDTKQQQEFYVEADNMKQKEELYMDNIQREQTTDRKQQELSEDSFQIEHTNIQNEEDNHTNQQELDVDSIDHENAKNMKKQEVDVDSDQNEQADIMKHEQKLDSDNVRNEQANI